MTLVLEQSHPLAQRHSTHDITVTLPQASSLHCYVLLTSP